MAITNLHIDFDFLKTKDCKTLKIIDQSNWSIYASETAYIQIKTPGATKCISLVFQKEKINIYESNNLGLTDVRNYSSLGVIPDGIYEVTVLRCENDSKAVTKYFLQDCLIKCQLAKKLMSIDLGCEPCRKDLLKEIQDITLFLDAAQAQVDNCNVNKAMEYYRRATTILDRISDSDSNCTSCH